MLDCVGGARRTRRPEPPLTFMELERELYQLWQTTATPGRAFRCSDGTSVLVISSGRRNESRGPDYLDAVLVIDGTLRVGAVEMHLHERDWFDHGHDTDPAYRQVILHVLDDLDGRQRLPIPTVVRSTIERDGEVGDRVVIAAADRGSGDERIQPALLAELAWSRMLRRTSLLVRSGPGIATQTAVRLAFVHGLFDGLGYARNRTPMRRLADVVARSASGFAGTSFDDIAATLLAVSGLDVGAFLEAGRSFLCEDRMRAIGAGAWELRDRWGTSCGDWHGDVRPANQPERRLWAAAAYVHRLFNESMDTRLLGCLTRSCACDAAADQLLVRMGTEAFVGPGRALAMVINTVIPISLAVGVACSHPAMITATCRAYRDAPPTGSNGIIRDFERRLGVEVSSMGAFWQQGAIEFWQRYQTADHANLSFASEPHSSWRGR